MGDWLPCVTQSPVSKVHQDASNSKNQFSQIDQDVLASMKKVLKGWGGNEGGVLAADGTVVTFAAVHLHDSC